MQRAASSSPIQNPQSLSPTSREAHNSKLAWADEEKAKSIPGQAQDIQLKNVKKAQDSSELLGGIAALHDRCKVVLDKFVNFKNRVSSESEILE